MREPVALAGVLWALGPLIVAVCQLSPPPGACLGSLTVVAERACAGGPDAVEGAARLLFGGRLDANRAGAAAFQLLPGIGPKRAAAIVVARGERPFGCLAALERAHGVGPATVERLRPWLRVEPRVAEAGSGSPLCRGGTP